MVIGNIQKALTNHHPVSTGPKHSQTGLNAQAPGVTSPINTSHESSEKIFGQSSKGSPALHTCAQFLLRQGEFTRLSNGSVFVSNYNLLLSPGQYRPASPASPGSLYICTPEAIASRGQVSLSSHIAFSYHICPFVQIIMFYKILQLRQSSHPSWAT